MASVHQIRRRIGSAGAPPTLAEGQLGYNDPGDDEPDALYIGSDDDGTPIVKPLVSSSRQVELEGDQTITGDKTFTISNLKVTGGAANNLIVTDGDGNLSFTSSPEGGLLTVAVDATLDGDGTDASPLSVLSLATARTVTIQADPDGGTEISLVAAEFDGTEDAIITDFSITKLDDGVY